MIDAGALKRTLDRWLASDDDQMQTYEAPAVVHMECGHRRPTNLWISPGDLEYCLFCGPGQVVVRLELLDEPMVFPHPDALAALPEAC